MKRRFVIFFLYLLMLPLVHADIGPKPSMSFNFVYDNGIDAEITSGVQYECEAADCSDAVPLKSYGPQHFACKEKNASEKGCFSMSYGYNHFSKLMINFSDKPRESNVFSAYAMNSKYNVIVHEDSLEVRTPNNIVRAFSFVNLFYLIALIANILVETVIAFFILKFWFKLEMKRILLSLAVINLLTLTILWYIMYKIWVMAFFYVFGWPIMEAIIVPVEALLLYAFNKKALSLKRSFLLSLICNVGSIIVGILLFILLAMIARIFLI